MNTRKLAALFRVEPGEGRLVTLMLVLSFFFGISTSLASTGAYTLFTSQFGDAGLPYLYIAVSLVVSLVSLAYVRLSGRLSLARLLVVAVGFVLLVLAASRLGLSLTTALWITFVLPIGAELAYNLTSIAFWNLAGRLFDIQQGKRLFGFLGVGRELAKILGGFAVPFLVLWRGTPNLLFVAAAGMACALGLVVYLGRAYADSLAAPAAKKEPAKQPGTSSSWWKNRYALLILGMFLVSWGVWFSLQIVFYDQADVNFPSEDELASFLGLFSAVAGLLNLLAHSFLTAPALKRFGVRGSLLITPLILLANGALVVLVGTVAGTIAAFFWLVATMRLLMAVLRGSLDGPVMNILYQPLPPQQRLGVQTLVQGVGFSVSIGLSGVILLFLTTVRNRGPVALMYFVLLLVAVSLVVALLTRREYPRRLVEALAKRRLGFSPLALLDGSTRALLEPQLRSPYPGVVSYALTTLEEINTDLVTPWLPALLDHPHPDVRQDVLRRVERLAVTSAAPAVRQQLALEPSPPVRGTALRTLAALQPEEAFERLSPHLDDPAPEVRQGAMVGLLRHGGSEGTPAAESSLLRLASSSQPAERVLAAEALGQAGAERFSRLLVPLLADENPEVRRAALRAAGQLKSAELWPLVIAGLDSPAVRGAAASALVAGGEAVLPLLFAHLAEAGREPRRQSQLVSVCARIGGERAVAWLAGNLAHPDAQVRTQVLAGLSHCRYQPAGITIPEVEAQIAAEARLSAQILACQADIGQDESTHLVWRALDQRLAEGQERLFWLLSFLYDRQSILLARDNLAVASPANRAYAVEMVDTLVPPHLKRLFEPLLHSLPAGEKARRMGTLFPQPSLDRSLRLETIIAAPEGQPDAWLQTCALYAAGSSPAGAPAGAVEAALVAADPLVQETAAWAQARLTQARIGSQAGPSPNASGVAAGGGIPQPETGIPGGKKMLTTVEKVIALKKAPVLSGVPDQVLAELAPYVEEVEYTAGQAIFRQGDVGDSMFVVVDGQVRIHTHRTLNEVRAGEAFGEMAALDPGPRLVSATAVVDSLLLRLDAESLYEVMGGTAGVAHGIISALCRRLRTRANDLRPLMAQPEQ